MGEARRALTRAKLALEGKESQLRRSAFLLEQGLISASQHEDTERQYRSQSIDFEAGPSGFGGGASKGWRRSAEERGAGVEQCRRGDERA